MTTAEFFNNLIDSRSHKVLHNLAEYDDVKALPGVKLVKATTLYQIYKHSIFESEGRLSMGEFYKLCGQYLYYDKYVCDHGTEFYYYILFSSSNTYYKDAASVINKRVYANRPETLDDVKQIIEAVTKYNI